MEDEALGGDDGPEGTSLKTSVTATTGGITAGTDPLSIALVAVSSPEHYTLWNSLAVESLAGDLRGEFGAAIQVSIFRIRSFPEFEAVFQRLQTSVFDVVGVSVECGGTGLAQRLAQRLTEGAWHNGRPHPTLVFGGKIPTYLPELFLAHARAAIVVIGEGEVAFRRLVRSRLRHMRQPLASIPNLIFCNRTGKLQRTRVEKPDCSSLIHPPAVDTVPELLEKGAGTFLTQASRGCSWSNCTYCTVSSFRFREKWESLPWSRTLKHLEALVSLGVREFEFCDDEFIGGRGGEHWERILSVASDLAALGKNVRDGIVFRVFLIPWTVYAQDDPQGNVMVKRALERLKEAGLQRVYLGVESGSEPQLKRYCRHTTLTDITCALETVKDLGLAIDCGFIMFDPLATLEDIARNVEFFRKNGLIEYNQWPFRPLVANLGTSYGKMMARRGMTPDSGFMCYQYQFHDPDVQRVFDIVDNLSRERRSLFYALKVISKSHFDPQRETGDTKRARDLIIENGLIYLDLIEELTRAMTGPEDGQPVAEAEERARSRIERLVEEVRADRHSGRFRSLPQEKLMGLTPSELMSPAESASEARCASEL